MLNHYRIYVSALLVALTACGDPDTGSDLDVSMSALSACNENVPENRFIDGIPAYAQCAAVEMSAIYSNNGVDTSTSALGRDWVRTQRSGGYQCTELANRYLRFVWGVQWIPNGNAGTWCDTPPPASSGVVQSTTPTHGDLMVFAPGSCGAAQGTGHVALVDTVNGGKISAVEQNRARRGMYDVSCASCFLHVVANDGTKLPSPMRPADGGMPRAPAADASMASPDGGSGGRPRPSGADAGGSRGPTAQRDAASPMDEPEIRDAGTLGTAEDDGDDLGESASATTARPGPGDEDDDEGDVLPTREPSEASSSGCAVGGERSDASSLFWFALGLALIRRSSSRASQRDP